MIDCFSSLRHYSDHEAPIWFALPPETRGTWWAYGSEAEHGANIHGVPNWQRWTGANRGNLILVAGYTDEQTVNRPCIYLEHGAGQVYLDVEHPAYNGSIGHHNVRLFLCPREEVAVRWRNLYPDTPAVAVGCPKLDWFHAHPRPWPRSPKPTLAISFHSRIRLNAETDTAVFDYETGLHQAVPALRAAGWEILGHGHPRLWQQLRTFWGALNVEAVADFSEILHRADILAIDNSSVGPEFASCGGPVIWMNASGYRRTVHHGGRFWKWTEGMICIDSADELPAAAERAYAHEPGIEAARRRMVDSVYVACDGKATDRAAEAILSVRCAG